MKLKIIQRAKQHLPWANNYYGMVELKTTYELADEYYPRLRDAIIAGAREYSSGISERLIDALSRDYSTRAANYAINESDDLWQPLHDAALRIFAELYLVSGDESFDYMVGAKWRNKAYNESLGYDPVHMNEALLFSETEAAALVTAISEGTKGALQAITARGIEDGINPRVIARMIHRRGTDPFGVGLANAGPNSYGVLERYRQRLVADGYSGKRLETAVRARSKLLLRRRSEAIARSEMIRTQSTATRRVWERGISEGLVDNRARRVWIASPGPRTCAECMMADGQVARVGEPYLNGVMGPPLHVMCRCSEGLRFARQDLSRGDLERENQRAAEIAAKKVEARKTRDKLRRGQSVDGIVPVTLQQGIESRR